MTDIIDQLVGIAPGSRLDVLRRRRPDAREHAQRTHEALFVPSFELPAGRGVSDIGLEEVTQAERHAVAAFVAGLHRQEAVTALHAAALDPDLAKRIAVQAEEARTTGPYGRYREPELAGESVEGPRYRAEGIDGRLAAALEHAHLLVFRPREASPEALAELREAGWSFTGIVTLSQLVAFLTFQIRVATALGALA
ncbi:CMD domain protein [Nonomuraea sp. NPDC049152]|uniref:CMD domain protein n=1 Tax=Nonomuraea sp. NPDC049152 TaxID=3154350 RepID=UPI0033CFD2B8